MTSIDRAGIFVAVAITAIAVGFAAIGGTEPMMKSVPEERSFTTTTELQKEVEVVKKTIEEMEEVAKEVKETSDETKAFTQEKISAKLPARFVSIPQGTSVPGCESVNLCYDPPYVTIFVGGEIIWRNDDSSPHTVTSGNALTGPDGFFDSGLLKAGQTFSQRFDETGDYRYFCMIHPWAEGIVIVE